MNEKLPKHVRKNSILLYGDYAALVKRLPVKERGYIFTALLEYAETGEESETHFSNPLTDVIYSFIINGLIRDRKNYLELCENNRKRAETRWERERQKRESTAEEEQGEAR